MGEWGGIYRLLVREHDGKSSFVRPRFRWEDNIKIELLEVEW